MFTKSTCIDLLRPAFRKGKKWGKKGRDGGKISERGEQWGGH